MRDERTGWSWPARALVLVGIVAAGLIGIVGSGGGGGGCFGLASEGCISIGPSADAFVSPSRVTVPVGGSVTFTVSTSSSTPFSVQWKRSRDRGATYAAIPGATNPNLTITGTLPDDDTLYFAEVSIPNTLVFGPFLPGRLFVSSMPGVPFADGEFQAGDWSATADASPATNGPTFGDTQTATGGNPGAFRTMTYAFPSGAGSLRVSYASQSAVYDPALLGAIHTIDFAQDCIVFDAAAAIGRVRIFPSIEQAGRRYAALSQPSCSVAIWHTESWPSLLAADFVQVDGPACGAGESCPDFSAAGTPLTFGYARTASQAASAPAGSIAHGIDNWKVTAWRR